MAQTAEQIESHILHLRGDLSSDIQELGQRVRSATDWRRQFQNHPMAMLGAAFGGGILLATLFRGRDRRRRHQYRA
jgi:hypothetical protein